jgi:hypothetical protein
VSGPRPYKGMNKAPYGDPYSAWRDYSKTEEVGRSSPKGPNDINEVRDIIDPDTTRDFLKRKKRPKKNPRMDIGWFSGKNRGKK